MSKFGRQSVYINLTYWKTSVRISAHTATFLSNTLPFLVSVCKFSQCVQLWLQIAPDQWPHCGHAAFIRAGQDTWPHVLQTWCATRPSPVGQSEWKEGFSTFWWPWCAPSWSQLSRDVPLELHEILYMFPKQVFGVAVMVPNLNDVVRELLLGMLLDKVRPRTFAGHGRVRILEREDDISFFVRNIDGRLAVLRRHHEQG